MEEFLVFLRNLHNNVINFSKDIKFDKNHPQQLHLIGLYGSIIELSDCLITLSEKQLWIGIPVIFRSLLESHVELINLHKDADYLHHMVANYYSGLLRLLREAKINSQNPFLSEIARYKELDLQISEKEKELKSLKIRGINPLKLSQRFEKAGLLDVYKSIYNSLCSDAHCDIRSLIYRHYDIKGEDFSVVFYSDKPSKSYTYIDLTAGVLIDTSEKINNYFKSGLEDKIREFDNKLKELRKETYTKVLG